MVEAGAERVLAKALTDDVFRSRLISDPDAVFNEYGLSEEGRRMFDGFEEKRLGLVKAVKQKGYGMSM